MTQIDFYVLGESAGQDLENLACRLAEKALHAGSRIYFCCRDQAQLEQLDQLLWSWRASSFLPHTLELTDERCPIHLGMGTPPDHHQDILINLSGQIPEGYQRFERILELVPAEHGAREASRKNWGHYRDRGYPLHKHDMN